MYLRKSSRNPDVNFIVGRPFVYGLACGGQAGVEQVIKSILADLEITLGLTGYKSLDEVRGKADEVLIRMDH